MRWSVVWLVVTAFALNICRQVQKSDIRLRSILKPERCNRLRHNAHRRERSIHTTNSHLPGATGSTENDNTEQTFNHQNFNNDHRLDFKLFESKQLNDSLGRDGAKLTARASARNYEKHSIRPNWLKSDASLTHNEVLKCQPNFTCGKTGTKLMQIVKIKSPSVTKTKINSPETQALSQNLSTPKFRLRYAQRDKQLSDSFSDPKQIQAFTSNRHVRQTSTPYLQISNVIPKILNFVWHSKQLSNVQHTSAPTKTRTGVTISPSTSPTSTPYKRSLHTWQSTIINARTSRPDQSIHFNQRTATVTNTEYSRPVQDILLNHRKPTVIDVTTMRSDQSVVLNQRTATVTNTESTRLDRYIPLTHRTATRTRLNHGILDNLRTATIINTESKRQSQNILLNQRTAKVIIVTTTRPNQGVTFNQQTTTLTNMEYTRQDQDIFLNQRKPTTIVKNALHNVQRSTLVVDSNKYLPNSSQSSGVKNSLAHSKNLRNNYPDNYQYKPIFVHYGENIMVQDQLICPLSLCSSSKCYCDDVCLLYNDCCLEYLLNITSNNITKIVDSTEQLLEGAIHRSEQRKITEFRRYSRCVLTSDVYVLMISACPGNYTADYEVKRRCENPLQRSIENFPVDYYDDNNFLNIYQNVHCALCHGKDLEILRFWKITATCLKSIFLEKNDLTDRFCNFHYHLPPNSRSQIRICPYPTSHNQKVQNDASENISVECALCPRYANPIIGTDQFRNVYCFHCLEQSRPKSGTNMSCFNPVITSDGKNTGLIFGSDIRVVFDFNPSSGIQIRNSCIKDKTCQEYELYDCASKTCRVQYCPNGQVAWKGICKALDTKLDWNAVTETSTFSLGDMVRNPCDINAPVPVQDTVDPKSLIFEIEIAVNLQKNISQREEVILEYVQSILEMFGDIYVVGSLKLKDQFVVSKGLLLQIVLAITSWEKLPDIPLKSILNTTAIPRWKTFRALEIRLDKISIRNYITENNLICQEGSVTHLVGSELNYENDSASVKLWGIVFSLDRFAFQLTTYPSTEKEAISLLFCKGLAPIQDPTLKCAVVGFSPGEYLITNNCSTLKLIKGNVVYLNDEFTIIKERVYVCASSLLSNQITIYFNYSRPQRILSMVLTSISTVALIGLLVQSIYNRRRCNLHGLNLLALSGCLVMSQSLTFLNNLPKGIACTIAGAVLHFLWLSVFSWMTIIGYNVAHTFWNPIKSLSKFRFDKRQFSTFKKYAFVGFGGPVVVVAICLTSDFTLKRPVGYGLYNFCWITKPLAVLIAVTIPMIISVSFNLLMLVLTICAIEKSKHETKLATKSGQRCMCISYLKLTIFFGISWTFGVVAALASAEFLWYIHVIFNGLQGLAIFICYIFSNKSQAADTTGVSTRANNIST